MKVISCDSTSAKEVSAEGAQGVKIRQLITQAQGAQNFTMRLFEIEPGGLTPLHEHEWEHEVFIVSGTGELRGETMMQFAQGDAVFVEPGVTHHFVNTGSDVLRFICCIPMHGK